MHNYIIKTDLMDKNCSIHAKTPTYHGTLLNVYACTYTYICVPTYVYTLPKCREIHFTKHCTAEILPYFQSVFLSLNLPHEGEPQTGSLRFWLCDAILLPSLSS